VPRTAKLPKGIDRLPSGNYRVRIMVDGARYTIGASYQNLKDAKAGLTIARAELARGIFIPPQDRKAAKRRAALTDEAAKVTVDELADRWLEWLPAAGRKQGTVDAYRSRYTLDIQPHLGNRSVVDLTVKDIDDWHAALEQKKGQSVARNAYGALRSMFAYASGTAQGQSRAFVPLIRESPVQVPGAGAHRRVRNGEDVVFTQSQIEQLADLMPDRLRIAVLLCGSIGLRIGEVMDLRRSCFNVGPQGLVWVSIHHQVQSRHGLHRETPKSKAGTRELPMPSSLKPALNHHLERYVAKGPESRLFPSPTRPNYWVHPNIARRAFREALARLPEAAELEGATWHTLRHSALTIIGQRGATTAELMKFAGHANPQVVQKYQHAEKNRLAALVG
jgi:integrase